MGSTVVLRQGKRRSPPTPRSSHPVSEITIQDDARAWYTNRSLDHLALAAHITSLTLSREAGDEPVAVPGKMAPNTWPAKGDGR